LEPLDISPNGRDGTVENVGTDTLRARPISVLRAAGIID
jgi:hypothetical protein